MGGDLGRPLCLRTSLYSLMPSNYTHSCTFYMTSKMLNTISTSCMLNTSTMCPRHIHPQVPLGGGRSGKVWHPVPDIEKYLCVSFPLKLVAVRQLNIVKTQILCFSQHNCSGKEWSRELNSRILTSVLRYQLWDHHPTLRNNMVLSTLPSPYQHLPAWLLPSSPLFLWETSSPGHPSLVLVADLCLLISYMGSYASV